MAGSQLCCTTLFGRFHRVHIAPRDKREMGRGRRGKSDGITEIAFELVTWTGTPGTGSGGQAFLFFLIDILFYITVYVLGCKFADGTLESTICLHLFISILYSKVP
jgi:hypothetical protein